MGFFGSVLGLVVVGRRRLLISVNPGLLWLYGVYADAAQAVEENVERGVEFVEANKKWIYFSLVVGLISGIIFLSGGLAGTVSPTVDQIGNARTYVHYSLDKEFDIVQGKIVPVANDSSLDSAKAPYNDFLVVNVTVTTNGGDITFTYVGANSPVTVANATELRSSRAPYSDFLSLNVRVFTNGTDVFIGYFYHDIDDDMVTTASGGSAGDDVLRSDTDDTWDGQFVVSDSLTSLSTNFDINENYLNNWYLA
jgi:hypothetical protein